MLTKYKDVKRLNTEQGVNEPFENISCQRCIQNFFREEALNFDIFSSVFFQAEIIWSKLRNRKGCFKKDK